MTGYDCSVGKTIKLIIKISSFVQVHDSLTLPCIEDNGLIPVPIWTRPFSINCDFRRLVEKKTKTQKHF